MTSGVPTSCCVNRSEDSSTQTDELTYEEIVAIAEHLKERLKDASISPDVGIICGSGLGRLGENLDSDKPKVVFPYNELPNFPKTTGEESFTACHKAIECM